DSAEFSFFENKWRYRNYSVFKDIIKENVTQNIDVVNKILFYTINCSKQQLSTILWFPEDLDNIDEYINTATKNSFVNQNINITDSTYTNHIFRCLSSDGATIIDKDGNLLYLGVIINLNKAKVSGIVGTGESAASILKGNGLSIKISSDGMIKIFTKNNDKPI